MKSSCLFFYVYEWCNYHWDMLKTIFKFEHACSRRLKVKAQSHHVYLLKQGSSIKSELNPSPK